MSTQYINITISPETVEYESELDIPEVIFWLETVKTMVVQKVLEESNE